ncbi:MAG: CCA tRNA nucleotidyltransferase [Pirellulaceae bacterium]
MSRPDPTAARQFAIEVVGRLRTAGFEALFAGGCVRDELLGNVPKDYDVATSATPEQIQEVFGRRQTLAIGASFGVITVLGGNRAGQIDVATFRQDAGYSDGRHPDAVRFTTAEQDALRRDFTINGLFWDPAERRVIDFVGGQEDLRRGILRAIGDPRQRISEDKLRMLRAVRFAARFDFQIDAATLAAIQAQARELPIVSAERIAAEMRHILTHASRARGVMLLYEAGLLEVALPEAAILQPELGIGAAEARLAWERTLRILQRLDRPTFAMALAALLRKIELLQPGMPRRLFDRWKLSTDEFEAVAKFLREELPIRQAKLMPWPELQRILIAPRVEELLGYCTAVAEECEDGMAEIDFCRAKLALPADAINPRPLITGEDLKRLGFSPGPGFRDLLEAVRDAQLEGRIATTEEALDLVKEQWPAR